MKRSKRTDESELIAIYSAEAKVLSRQVCARQQHFLSVALRAVKDGKPSEPLGVLAGTPR